MEQQAATPKTDLETRMFMPAWWVQAFLNAEDGGRQDFPPFYIVPLLSRTELALVAVCLGMLQRRLLQGNPQTLNLELKEINRLLALKRRESDAERVRGLQLFSLLRVLPPAGEESSLFEKVQWHWTDQESATSGFPQSFSVSRDDVCLELVFGMTHAHRDLLRRARQQAPIHAAINHWGPLGCWRSLWADLSETEQLLYLEVERAMQWQDAWLHFDGVFGIPVQALEQRLTGRHVTRSNAVPFMVHLERFSKKLGNHGLTKKAVGAEYLAFSALQNEDVYFIWQASEQRLYEQELQTYRNQVQAFFLKAWTRKDYEDLIDLMATQRLAESSRAEKRRAVEKILEHGGDALSKAFFRRNELVLALPLFIEWSIRQEKWHTLPLAEDIKSSSVAELCKNLSDDNLVERFTHFAEAFASNSSGLDLTSELSLWSLAEKTSAEHPEWGRLIAAFGQRQGDWSQDHKQSKGPSSDLDIGYERSVRQGAEADDQLKKNQSQAKMRQIAAQELQRIKERDPDQYASIKKSYLASLDGPRQKMIQDVQLRMEPQHFENHLKNSLIKFMIENPAAWRSVAGV